MPASIPAKAAAALPRTFCRKRQIGVEDAAVSNCELMAKGQILQEEVAARKARLNDQIEQGLQRTEHEPVVAEASRISMQMAVGFFPVHTPLYPIERTRLPARQRRLSTEGSPSAPGGTW
jgi:hypothetical protein